MLRKCLRALAGSSDDYWRQEFVKLVELAESKVHYGGRE